MQFLKKKNFRHVCDKCNKLFARRQQLESHRRSFHDKIFKNNKIECDICQKVFDELHSLRAHLKIEHESNLNYKKIKSIFDDKNVIYRKYFAQNKTLLPDIVNKKSEVQEITNTIYTYLLTHPYIKFSLNICYRNVIFLKLLKTF